LSSRGRLMRRFVFAAYGLASNGAIAETTLSFDCTPSVSPSLSDRDPVIRTSIAINGTLWRITHVRASGDNVERTDQYRMSDISDQSSLAWQGVLILRPYLKMIGQLSGDRSEYIETLYDARKGGAEIAQFKSLCNPTASQQRPQSAETTAAPTLSPAPRPGAGCSAVNDPTQRLACYDSAFGAPPSPSAPPVVAAPAPAPTVAAASPPPPPPQPLPAPPPATSVSSPDANSTPLSESDLPAMNDDFSKNEIRFGRNYVGRPFHGTLPLYSISEEMFTKGAYSVSFGDHTSGVDCVVSDKNNLDYITKLNTGDNVTIFGRVDSHAIGFDVKLSQCEFARP
jgi:hypothetical protein